jgi:hypothetical protein
MKPTCPTCHGAITEGQPCPICAALERLRAKAAELGALRHPRDGRELKKPLAQPPEGMWWQA